MSPRTRALLLGALFGALLGVALYGCVNACYKPKHRCVRSHYVHSTCFTIITDGRGNVSGMIPYECGSDHCDEYETRLNPEWQGDPKCNKPELTP
jgi:hypothetical protein